MRHPRSLSNMRGARSDAREVQRFSQSERELVAVRQEVTRENSSTPSCSEIHMLLERVSFFTDVAVAGDVAVIVIVLLSAAGRRGAPAANAAPPSSALAPSSGDVGAATAPTPAEATHRAHNTSMFTIAPLGLYAGCSHR